MSKAKKTKFFGMEFVLDPTLPPDTIKAIGPNGPKLFRIINLGKPPDIKKIAERLFKKGGKALVRHFRKRMFKYGPQHKWIGW